MKIWIAVLALAAGCSKDNPYYCAGNPDDNCALDGGNGDAPQACTSSDQCTGALGVCDTVNDVCVACTASETDSCTGATPVCSTENTCRGCTANTECASGACMPDGSCADAATLLFAAPDVTSATCAIDNPCSIYDAINLATAGRNTIVLAEGTYMTGTVVVTDREVTLLGRGARVTKNAGSDGAVFRVTGTGKATFLYMHFDSGDGASLGHALRCEPGGALTARFVTLENNAAMGVYADACNLTIDGSTIRGNPAGGIYVSGTNQPFTITNNVIYNNGGTASALFGGVKIELTQFTNSRMEFNSIVENIAISNSSYSGGVVCASSDFSPANNIIASNYVGASNSSANAQEFGDCNHQSSIIQNDVTGLMFVDATPPMLDLHIADGSTARDAATVASPVAVDFEGDARSDGMKDIGADELK